LANKANKCHCHEAAELAKAPLAKECYHLKCVKLAAAMTAMDLYVEQQRQEADFFGGIGSVGKKRIAIAAS
jgi:hypothetical protein